jgi:hypothetical protein
MPTRCIGCIGEILPILRTLDIHTPKGTADFALRKPRQVNMTLEFSLGKRNSEVVRINLVVEKSPNEDWKIIMAICIAVSILAPPNLKDIVPINGVPDRILSTLCSMLRGALNRGDTVVKTRRHASMSVTAKRRR